MEALGGPQALPVTRDAAYRWTMLARAGTCDAAADDFDGDGGCGGSGGAAGDATPPPPRRAWAPATQRRRGYETRYAATSFDTAAPPSPSTDAAGVVALSRGCFAVPRAALRRWRRFDERPNCTSWGSTQP